jgi:hypothetical protein
MEDEWAGMRWSEEQEQAHEDKRALRALACPRKDCRRLRACRAARVAGRGCPSYAAFPDTEEELADYEASLIAFLKRSVAEDDADPVAAEIANQARLKRSKEREALAFQRVKAWLKEGETPEEIFRRVAGRE